MESTNKMYLEKGVESPNCKYDCDVPNVQVFFLLIT